MYFIPDVILKDVYEFTDVDKKAIQFIIDQLPNKDQNYCSYLCTEKQKDFYEELGFVLYKDYKTFRTGENLMRFVMEKPKFKI